jgi:GntR family transcriptional repressor for pyruvate dehydrogenase complex
MEPIHKKAAHKHVVDRLRRAIHLGDYLPGDMLPPERDIADKLGVARETVREAIRALAREGYVVSRRGPSGGHVVTELSEPKRRTLEELKVDREALTHLLEFRRANECLAARLAAERRSDDDLARMSAAVDDLSESNDIQRFRRADSSFHVAIASASRNPYVERAVIDARERIFLLHDGLDFEVILGTTLDSHRRILDAIRAHDCGQAEEAMDEHMVVAMKEIRNVLLGKDDAT